MSIRYPAVAGQFYPASPEACRAEARAQLEPPADTTTSRAMKLLGGIVPHAGWVCSGAVAGQVIAAFRDRTVETFVVFGAVHRVLRRQASACTEGTWKTPVGEMVIDEELAQAVVDASDLLVDDARTHMVEHAIEVQLPFLQIVQPSARLLPIGVPPIDQAAEVGTFVADKVRELGRQAVFLGSSDLTHYGPRYGFMPAGAGTHGLHWAKDNDRRIIELCLKLDAENVVTEAREHQNACGAGAIAATLAAARASGATEGVLLQHTTSAEVLRERWGPSTDAVGYAGILLYSQGPNEPA